MTQLVSDADVDLALDFVNVRKVTMELFQPLSIEDAVMQSDIFGSPPNWHLAHVTWFFHKILEKHGEKMAEEQDGINLKYLNSYYQRYGDVLPKSERGKFPRPTVKQTLAYRAIIDNAVISFLEKKSVQKDAAYDMVLGMQHEMQHQELMIYDFQHYFSRFPDPADNYKPTTMESAKSVMGSRPAGMVDIPGGIYELGFNGKGFCYDNELPEHKVYLQPFKIDVAPVTNGDYIKFIESGGYGNYKFWLADGWDLVRENKWNAPLYWEKKQSTWYRKDFRAADEIDPDEPVVNVSYYEADAYARWAGKRLPTEAEWEKAASWNEGRGRKTLYPWGDERPTPSRANLLGSFLWGPSKVGSFPDGASYYGCHHMLGDVWEWTSSEYVLYPGFMSRFPEYTDKWAVSQKVLRGGCFATPARQIRNAYRNYFKPHERIVFAGFRCAQDRSENN
ncbi:MAG: ergothioneine biosynthesis protein EgtB [Nitrososphaera sp.]